MEDNMKKNDMQQIIWRASLVFIWLFSLTVTAFAGSDNKLLEQGWDLKDAGKQQEANEVFKKAIVDFNKVIEHDPKDGVTYNRRGVVYFAMENHAQAIQDFTKSLELDPKKAFVYCNRGNAYKMSGDIERAIKDFDKSIELDPQDGKAYDLRGRAYEMSGNYQLALADYLTATEKDPHGEHAYYDMARVFALQKNPEKACLSLAKSKEVSSRRWKFLYKEQDFKNIKDDPCYKQVIEKK
jgi:tetratricopeptide (TPR) repeat protein